MPNRELRAVDSASAVVAVPEGMVPRVSAAATAAYPHRPPATVTVLDEFRDPTEVRPAARTVRLQTLDGARALFVLLGLVLHSAGPYLATSSWVIRDPQHSVALTWLHAAIHAFRMPGFFLIAGVLSALACRRLSRADFLKKRAVRLGVPFVLALGTLAVLEQQLFDAARQRLCAPESTCTSLGEHGFVAHLWFLPMLMLVTVLVALAPERARAAVHRALSRLARFGPALAHPYAVAGVASLAWYAWTLGVLAVARVPGAWHEFGGFLSAPTLLDSLFFYAAGVALAGFPALVQWLQRRVPARTIVVLFAVGSLALAVSRTVPWPDAVAGRLALVLCGSVATVVLLQAVLHASLHAYERWSGAVEFASRHAYGVYLLHHVVVVACALALLPFEIGALPKFALVLAATTVVSFGVSMLYASAKAHLALTRASTRAPSAT